MYEWKKRFPEFSEALKKNKELADIVIENELYESCKGRTVTIKKPIKVKKVRVTEKGERFETETIEYANEEVHIPPSTTAQIFWLKNRRPDRWRDKQPDADNKQALDRLAECPSKNSALFNLMRNNIC